MKNLSIKWPQAQNCLLSQDEEFVYIQSNGAEDVKIRFHDYHEIYKIPGLYEEIFYKKLNCQSPRKIMALLRPVLKQQEWLESVAIEIGAGNGLVGELLKEENLSEIIGIDIIEEAREAAKRDRPEVYTDYLVFDLADRDGPQYSQLSERPIHLMLSVAALGFGDIPPATFQSGFDLLITGGIFAFTIKKEFLEPEDQSGYFKMLSSLQVEGYAEILKRETYFHRHSTLGGDIEYTAIVGRKIRR